MRRLLAAVILVTVGLVALPSGAQARTRSDCAVIVREFSRQGASRSVATRFGQIAWRESGCSLQCVSDSDDFSCSRLGLNFKGSLARGWARLCGARTREATKALGTDVHCALMAYRSLGWRPWR